MGLFGKIFKRHDTIPASGPETTRVDKMPTIPPASPDQTIRDLPKPTSVEGLKDVRSESVEEEVARIEAAFKRGDVIAPSARALEEMQRRVAGGDEKKLEEIRKIFRQPEKR